MTRSLFSVLLHSMDSPVQEILEGIQKRAMKMNRRMEHLTCEDRLREVRLFRLWKDIIVAFRSLREASKMDGKGVFFFVGACIDIEG